MYKWNSEELKDQVAIFFKVHRLRKGLSQFQVGNEVDLTKDYIGKIERSKTNPTIDVINSLCNFLEIDIKTLVTKVTENQLEILKIEITELESKSKNLHKKKI
ncbi:helix-turn-helix domain-containing protein [Chryseobacterium caseinilyticum]|uniref:Helix-turn-helix transcriptional regulator n=1 Tax=Chryseobacterium caseinilyticum TaxID=2771428 RepID=A0ABR8ZGQ9_9FLAO|nr:helix-turn-helix transcriptional regulator [Chryseobacterium caseinilyticum]MBD8084485.1 helix-turn-helix transcriptional regulator [Chryseobacterium caseinilyticum]